MDFSEAAGAMGVAAGATIATGRSLAVRFENHNLLAAK